MVQMCVFLCDCIELTLTTCSYPTAGHQAVSVCWGYSSGVFACHPISCCEPAASENSGMTLSQQFVKIQGNCEVTVAEAISDENCRFRNAFLQSMFGWSPVVQTSHQCLPFMDVPQFLFALLLLLLLYLRAFSLVTTLDAARNVPCLPVEPEVAQHHVAQLSPPSAY